VARFILLLFLSALLVAPKAGAQNRYYLRIIWCDNKIAATINGDVVCELHDDGLHPMEKWIDITEYLSGHRNILEVYAWNDRTVAATGTEPTKNPWHIEIDICYSAAPQPNAGNSTSILHLDKHGEENSPYADIKVGSWERIVYRE
jgi:hypothetical protein